MRAAIFIFSLFVSFTIATAQNVVIDKQAIGQVVKNSASAIGKETFVKENVAKARTAQEVINKYTTIIQVNMERIQKAEQDVSAFKEGTMNIKVLSYYLHACTLELLHLSQEIPKYPFGALAYNQHIKVLSERIAGIGASVTYAVTDGQTQFFLSGKRKLRIENFISPVKRLELINACIYELKKILSTARDIRINLVMRNNIRDVSLAIAPTAVLSADMFKQISNDVIRLWQKQPSYYF